MLIAGVRLAGMPFKICVYNYKGGAAKTTITVNLAAALAKNQGKKVLMVDLDPQCNATQFWNTDDCDESAADINDAVGSQSGGVTGAGGDGSGGETRIDSDALHTARRHSDMTAFVMSDVTPTNTHLYKMLAAHFTLGDQQDLDRLLEEDECVSECNAQFFKGNLWLLKGSQLIFKFEPQISEALHDKTLADKSVKPIGIISYIVNKLAEKHNFDIIIMDLSPSNSSLNQICALSCDYILPPCNASLYSCGSIYGLLETVLPGQEGWLGAHKRFAEQWGPVWEQTEMGKRLLPFCLPRTPPKLLPILVTNYGMVSDSSKVRAATQLSRKRPAPDSVPDTPPTVCFQPSQFIYTLESYLKTCNTVNRDGNNRPGPLIDFRANCGREVIAFCPSVPVSIAATEALGRPFVEIELEDFCEFYNFDPQEMEGLQKKFKGRSKILKLLMDLNLLKGLDFNSNTVFKSEVELVKRRFESLAEWLVKDVFASSSAASSPASSSASARSVNGAVGVKIEGAG